MNHKRRRPKQSRAGCLLCKPHKRPGVNVERASVARLAPDADALCHEPPVHPAEIDLIVHDFYCDETGRRERERWGDCDPETRHRPLGATIADIWRAA